MRMKNSSRQAIESNYLADEKTLLARLSRQADLDQSARSSICADASELVERIRAAANPGLMDVFLSEYGLSTDEGIALMCLAEALLRVPDAETIDALIEDKIAPSDWGKHLGQSTSSLVNASTWGLLLTGKMLSERPPGPVGHLHRVVKRLGEPVIRAAVSRAMKEMGHQFVLGENIVRAKDRASDMEKLGFTYSFDMLGEAARTESDAQQYHLSYSRAISSIAENCSGTDPKLNPGISVKLSALHPRYEVAQRRRVVAELIPRVRSLALIAKSAGQGLNIDAEEADRLSLSLDIFAALATDPSLDHWDGLGIVVQAYSQRASFVLDWLYELAGQTKRRLMVRLVKGAYWDTEIKRAQALGLSGFPVFTSKAATDISYLACARKLLSMTERMYPQFATHNAHTVQAVLHMAKAMGRPTHTFEFQRLHGMGEVLHSLVMQRYSSRCRIYAPVGAHKDLLAYLVRRLLENGANSSFVNQIVDQSVPADVVAADPFALPIRQQALPTGATLFAPERKNSQGWDISDLTTLQRADQGRGQFRNSQWIASAEAQRSACAEQLRRAVYNPAQPSDVVGYVYDASQELISAAIDSAEPWNVGPLQRLEILNKVADAYESNSTELFALLHREAGKTLADAVSEVREAVDFLRYYATQIETASVGSNTGRWVCISPWNFPLAIFTGQIAAALAAGNAVLAKPAVQTCLVAHYAATLMHKAGVPKFALQLLPGGAEVGAQLTRSKAINGVAFTGSTVTAGKIRKSMATNAAPGTPLIAETGGLNAMIVDSTALLEVAVRDILQSAFQSAGQRCSALRCLYVQEDISSELVDMLKGAMNELQLGDPWLLATDVGPVIDASAHRKISEHIDLARHEGRLLHQLIAPASGHFVAPSLIAVSGISDIAEEIFGPVLHVATFTADRLDEVLDAINASGYGLTFGLHSRVDDRVQQVIEGLRVGNCYINRNQIGAIVGSQPFGGEGLSGTGPKAGGPHYLPRFVMQQQPVAVAPWERDADITTLQDALTSAWAHNTVSVTTMPGPTGESNQLWLITRGPVLCLGPGAEAEAQQAQAVEQLGGIAIKAIGTVAPDNLTWMNIAAAIWWGDESMGRAYDLALAGRSGAIINLITGLPDTAHVLHERLVSIDTTAAGGNPELLMAAADLS